MSVKSNLNSSRQSTASYWQGVIRDCEISGLSISKYCSLNKISTASFYTWRKILKAKEPSEKRSTPSFIPIDINDGGKYSDKSKQSSLEIHLPSGIKLIIHQGFNVEFLGQLLKEVG